MIEVYIVNNLSEYNHSVWKIVFNKKYFFVTLSLEV